MKYKMTLRYIYGDFWVEASKTFNIAGDKTKNEIRYALLERALALVRSAGIEIDWSEEKSSIQESMPEDYTPEGYPRNSKPLREAFEKMLQRDGPVAKKVKRLLERKRKTRE